MFDKDLNLVRRFKYTDSYGTATAWWKDAALAKRQKAIMESSGQFSGHYPPAYNAMLGKFGLALASFLKTK